MGVSDRYEVSGALFRLVVSQGMKHENQVIYRDSTATVRHRMDTQAAAAGAGRTVKHTGLLYTDMP